MSLKNVQDFFIDELTDLNANVLYLENLIKDKELHIEEIELFIKEIEKDSIDDTMLSPLFVENNLKEKIKKEKAKIESDKRDISNIREDISELVNKKKILEVQLDSVSEYLSDEKIFVSKDILKQQIDFNKKTMTDLDDKLSAMKKSIDSYIRVDFKRVQIDFDKFQKDITNISNAIADNNKELNKIIG